MNVNGTFFEPPVVQRAALRDLHALGVDVGRADTFWVAIEPRPGTLHWGFTDVRVTALAAAGIRWQPIVDYSTPWAASAPGDDKAAPRPDAYAGFAAALARRYGPGGAFWRSHPRLPQLPVEAYEIWNEPDSGVFWRPQPDPAAYAVVYDRARTAIKAVDPHAIVVTGGLFPDGAARFIKAVRAATDVDAIGYHAYGADAPAALSNLHAFLHETGGDPVWLTELGWPLTGDGALSEDARTRAYRALLPATARICAVAEWAPYTWMSTPAQRYPDKRIFDLRAAGGPLAAARAYGDFVAASRKRVCG